jgi:hypothetical protein
MKTQVSTAKNKRNWTYLFHLKFWIKRGEKKLVYVEVEVR